MQACKSYLEHHYALKRSQWCDCHLELSILMEPFRGLRTEILLSPWSVLLEMSWEEGFFKLFIIRNQTISFCSTLGRPMKTLLWHLPPDSHSPQHFSRVAHIEPAKMLKLSQLLAHTYPGQCSRGQESQHSLPWGSCLAGPPEKLLFPHTDFHTFHSLSLIHFPPNVLHPMELSKKEY